ncbi:MAG: hypothetical protein HKL91_02885 [Candidatus Eremiobacteraeota bacterium]|uniref:Uncharacterized protein n=1 Tax=mine drainage metagenome TaxID=410659 RepID=E6PIK8_9ZZZZ|nr:hypothetical protein [Candidatus Eremiobacteraeota bacterium]
MIRAVLLAEALTSPSPAPSPIASPAAVPSPQASVQPVSAFMQVPKDWMLDDRIRILSPVTQIRFQAMKPYDGSNEAINVTEDDAPTTGTL